MLRDWRSTTSCSSLTSYTHPPRRNGWMTWHSERATLSCWTQERRYRAGWCSRRSARGALKSTRTCTTVFVTAEPTQVRSLKRHSISFSKPPKPNTHFGLFLAQRVVPRSWTVQDTKKVGLGDSLEMAYCPKLVHTSLADCSGTHSDPRVRRVGRAAVIIQGMSNCLGQTWNSGSGMVRGLCRSRDGSLRQTCKHPKPRQLSSQVAKRVSGGNSTKRSCSDLFEHHYAPVGILTFEAEVGMSGLQAKHG